MSEEDAAADEPGWQDRREVLEPQVTVRRGAVRRTAALRRDIAAGDFVRVRGEDALWRFFSGQVHGLRDQSAGSSGTRATRFYVRRDSCLLQMRSMSVGYRVGVRADRRLHASPRRFVTFRR